MSNVNQELPSSNEPMIKLQPGGIAPVLSYNVPEPTAYSGRNFIDLQLPDDYFLTTQVEPDMLSAKAALFFGAAANGEVTNRQSLQAEPVDRLLEARQSGQRLTTRLKNLDVEEVKQKASEGKKLNIYTTMTGALSYNFIDADAGKAPVYASAPAPGQFDPAISSLRALPAIEDDGGIANMLPRDPDWDPYPEPDPIPDPIVLGINITSPAANSLITGPNKGAKINITGKAYLSSGTGSVKTVQVQIASIRSYSQTESTAKSAATILDSVTDDISDDFEKSIASEQSNRKNYEESNEYKVEGQAGVSWGWGSASISASASGGTNAAREQFAKNVQNNTQKHVARASSRRDVQINTTYEEKTTSGDETSIVREIENINVSRTLNFVFRQMNQEFITLLHLVDVRIGFFKVETVNGEEKKTYQEVTLPELDSLISDTIVPSKRTEVRNAIIHQLTNIFDYQDRHHSFVEEEPFKDNDGNIIPLTNYLRVKKDYVSQYYDEATLSTIDVPGIILAANRHVLRTDGIVVEALLGQGEALDNYSRSLQSESVREKELRNNLLETEIQMKKLALQILAAKDMTGAEIYALLNPQPKAESAEESSAPNQPALTV